MIGAFFIMEVTMLIAFDDKVTRDYSVKTDTDPKTVFTLGTFDTFVRAKLESGLAKINSDIEEQAFWIIQIVKFGLKNWNLPIPFATEEIMIPGVGKRTVASDDTICKLRLEWINELATEIMKDNFVQAQELKN